MPTTKGIPPESATGLSLEPARTLGSDSQIHNVPEVAVSRPISKVCVLSTLLLLPILANAADVTAPSAPTALIAKVASCGQVGLSWTGSTDETRGSGLYAYIIQRWEGGNNVGEVAISAGRT